MRLQRGESFLEFRVNEQFFAVMTVISFQGDLHEILNNHAFQHTPETPAGQGTALWIGRGPEKCAGVIAYNVSGLHFLPAAGAGDGGDDISHLYLSSYRVL